MRYIIAFIFFGSIFHTAQAQLWKQKKIDDNVSVIFPKQFITLDTLGVKVLVSPSDGVSVTQIQGALEYKDPIKLQNAYKNFVEEYIASTKIQVLEEKLVYYRDIIGKRFLYRINGDDQTADVTMIYIDKCIYAFQMMHPSGVDVETILSERNLFLDSITFSKNLSEKDQLALSH